MLISLHLKNFRRHESLNLSFAEGLNGLFGKNYAGKSAVLLAIGVALGGPGWARGYRLVRRGTENFEVQLVFAADGVTYRVVRTKSGAKLFRVGPDDKLIASAQGQVNIELGKILGMPVDRWLELRFVRQKQAAQLFEAGSAKLNLLVEELTGVDTVSRVIEWLGRKGKTTTDQLEALRPLMLSDDQLSSQQQLVTDMRAEMAKHEPVLKDYAERGQALQSSLAALSQQVPAKRRELDAARPRNRELHSAQTELATMQRRQAALGEPPKVDAKALAAQIEEESATLKEWNAWLPTMKTAIAAHARAEAAYRNVESDKALEQLIDLAVLEDAQTAAEVESERCDQAIASFDLSLESLNGERVKLARELESGVCSGCSRPFADQDEAHRAELARRLEDLQAEIATKAAERPALAEAVRVARAAAKAAKQAVQDAAKHNQRVELQAGRVNTAKENLDVAKADMDKAQEGAPGVTIADAEGEIKRIEQGLAGLRQQLSQAQAWQTEATRVERALQIAQTKLNDLAGECETDEAIAQLEAELDQLTKALDERKDQVAKHDRKAAEARHQHEMAKRSMENAASLIEKDAEVRDRVLQGEAQLSEIEAFRKYLRDNRSRYLQRAWDLILGRASSFANAVTEGYVEEIRRTEAGTFQFIEQGEEAEVTDASGAQGAILGLSVQVALAETLPTHLDVFLADEPTADMDAEHSSAALMSLSAVSKQAMVISHHRMDESICKAVAEL